MDEEPALLLKNCDLIPPQLNPDSLSRRKFLAASLIGSATLIPSGCGMFLYPERRGQPAGAIDWKVVALDAVGLLLFFVPGLIAFAIDFSTGAIYLPPSTYGTTTKPSGKLTQVETLKPGELTRERVEQTLVKHTGKTVTLTPGEYKVTQLNRIENFWQTHTRLLKEKTSKFFRHVNFPQKPSV